ncbi:MAG: hypothetical protein HY704_04310 [Gemmatimonadetes bacterium]|nr:hypothetical protein [Gemmatimonadota bacterium]
MAFSVKELMIYALPRRTDAGAQGEAAECKVPDQPTCQICSPTPQRPTQCSEDPDDRTRCRICSPTPQRPTQCSEDPDDRTRCRICSPTPQRPTKMGDEDDTSDEDDKPDDARDEHPLAWTAHRACEHDLALLKEELRRALATTL